MAKQIKSKFFIKSKTSTYICLLPTEREIYKRVNQRFINMIDSGAIDEVKKLNTLDFDKSLPIMKAHGVPEISNYLSGKITLDQNVLIKHNK